MNTILLVDDDPQLRTIFRTALVRKGYRVVEAESGKAGLELARKHLPDLIITDIHMPGGDGATLLRDIRHDPELRSRQVVLMTGRPDLVTPRRGMEEGADDFLVKPVELAALISCVTARFSRASISWRVEDQTLAQLRTLVPAQLPHEFFTPLAGIIGLVEILRTEFPNMPAAEVIDIHRDIHQSATRLHRTLRNYLLILDLQTASAGRTEHALTAVELEESLRLGVREALRHNARSEDVTVKVEACPLAIKAEDLARIVEELVDNAFKFSRQGTPVVVHLSSDGRLIVTDEGRGLTEEEIGRIGVFQQFGRKKFEQQGLGLGLVLVQKLAALYRAKFSIKSQPGEGSRVEVAFPKRAAT
jgi:signal transduction histidine kinase